MARVPNVVRSERVFRPLIRAVRRVATTGPSCRVCGSTEVRRSLRRGFLDAAFACLFFAPFRCRVCRVRFYRLWRASPGTKESPRAPILMMPRQPLDIDPVAPRFVEPETIAPDPPKPERPLPRLVEPSPAAGKPMLFARPRSVLILESDLSIRRLLRRLLDRRGYFTHELLDPQELPGELRERSVDLLIVDAPFMGVNGMDTVLALGGVHPDLKILALALDSTDSRDNPTHCLTLTKPFSLESFLESVDRLLEPACTGGE